MEFLATIVPNNVFFFAHLSSVAAARTSAKNLD